METLSDKAIRDRLKQLSDWNREGDCIQRTFSVNDFVSAVELVNQFVDPAEDRNHHPDLKVSWGAVDVRLTTHDAGGITDKDFELAREFDRVYEEAFQ